LTANKEIPFTVYEPTKATAVNRSAENKQTRIVVHEPDEMGLAMVEAAWAVELRKEFEERRKGFKKTIDDLNKKLDTTKDGVKFNNYMKQIEEWEQKMHADQRAFALKLRTSDRPRWKPAALDVTKEIVGSSSSSSSSRFPKGDPQCEVQRADMERSGLVE
jgi:hypothetical protein